MSNVSKRRREGTRTKIKSMGDHKEFLQRISKTLYYGQLPSLPCLSLPVTEISCELWSEWQRGRSLRRLHADAASDIGRSACVSPCALVLALLYLERLHACNPDYLAATSPADLFLVSLMVSNKFLQDDGEDDEVICSEWAASGGIELNQLKKLEVEFLCAIDWNVFVSEKAFDAGLVWLERRVALRQARLRGFFTYGDLSTLAAPSLAALWAACAAWLAAATCVALLAAVLASSVHLAQHAAPTLRDLAARTAATTAPTQHDATPTDYDMTPTDFNTTESIEINLEELTNERLKCCTAWLQYEDVTISQSNWRDAALGRVAEWSASEAWWSRGSLLGWLSRSSLVDPLQRWLEKISEYGDFAHRELVTLNEPPSRKLDLCHGYENKHIGHCMRQQLNLSKLSAFFVSVSDR